MLSFSTIINSITRISIFSGLGLMLMGCGTIEDIQNAVDEVEKGIEATSAAYSRFVLRRVDAEEVAKDSAVALRLEQSSNTSGQAMTVMGNCDGAIVAVKNAGSDKLFLGAAARGCFVEFTKSTERYRSIVQNILKNGASYQIQADSTLVISNDEATLVFQPDFE